MIGSTVSHYRVVDEIGRGGMGVVYLAEDTRLGRSVALKFLADHLRPDDDARSRFMDEARAVARLNHANIATLYDIIDDGGPLFIALEYVRGRDLSAFVREKDLSTDAAVDFALQIARGLGHAHDAGIIHRDVKPQNLLVTEGGQVKILDFGLAKLAAGEHVTLDGSISGTPAYMSPEQISSMPVDARTDLWSLGAVMHELLTFERPFPGAYREALYYSILNAEAPLVSEVRPELGTAFDPIVRRLLAKDADDRYPSAQALMEDLAPLRTAEARSRSVQVPTSGRHEAEPEASSAAARPPSMVEERRQLSVVYAEITGFGDLLEATDPEDLLDLTEEYRSEWDVQVERFGALPGPVSGGTFQAYFGYPQASESDARNALRFGLAFRNAVARMSARDPASDDAGPPVRVGIHTGIAVVGSEHGRSNVRGNIGRVAALLTESISDGRVVTSKTTRKLSLGYFEFESLGEEHVRGFAEPVEAFEVVRESGARTRLDFIEDADLSPLVGRDAEVATLRQRWKEARSGQGSTVVVSGEAGLGKSRLVDSFSEEVIPSDSAWRVHLYCSSVDTNSALHPLVDFLKENVRSSDGGADSAPFERLHRFLTESGLDDPTDVWLMADLLGVSLPEGVQAPDLAAAERQRRTMIALFRIVTAGCAAAPGLIVVEDLHWADPSTLEWLGMLVSQAPAHPLLVLCTTRPHFRPSWQGKPRTAEVSLSKLDPADLAAISEHKSGKKLPREILDRIVAKTDGVPLFTEELTQMILEMGILEVRGDRYELTGPIPDHAIPSTLHGSLVARLDRFPTAKATAQIGAVLGREFGFELLSRVSEEDGEALKEALDRLVDAELIYQRGFYPDASFIFKHALIQDVAYETLLKSRRRVLHEKVAAALEEGPSPPELVAYHYTKASVAEKAISFWLQAGRRAMSRYENKEAVRHLKEGRKLVESLPEGRDRDLTELSILVPLGHALNMANGYWGPEGEAVLSRATELCESIDDVRPLVTALLGLGSTYIVRGHYARAREIARRALEAAGSADSGDFDVIGEYLLVAIELFRGALPAAIEHSEKVRRCYDPQKHAPLSELGSGNLLFASRLYRSYAKLLLGYPDEARVCMRRLLEEAKEGDYHFDLYQAHLYSGLLELTARDYSASRAVTERYLAIGGEYGDPFPMLITTAIHRLAVRGRGEEDVFRSAKGPMDTLRAAGYGLGYSVLLGQYAAGLLHYGDVQAAQLALDEAFDHIEEVGGEIWEAEIHRLQGVVLLQAGREAIEAEACFRDAVAIAHRQEAKLFELRAAADLARVLKGQDRAEEAHELLAGVYAWFTEGFDAVDLVEARDVMGSLPVS